MQNLDSFTKAYIVALLWTSTDEDGKPLDQYTIHDIHPDSLALIIMDCKAFQGTLEELDPRCIWSDTQAGYDFCLTRNNYGHGAGFWGGPVGEALAKACLPYGEQYLYIGDDGKLHI